MKRIGIVLSSAPSYSETFLLNKFNYMEKTGLKVVLFFPSRGKAKLPFEVSESFPLGKRSVLYFLPVMLALSIISPMATIRFARLLKIEGYGLGQLLKKIYFNAHILLSNIDHLHFEFAVIALGRESLARAKKIPLSVSIRGYDIALYPLKHKNCYTTLWKYLDKLHTISQDLLDIAYKEGLPKHIPTSKIPPALDISLYEPKQGSGILKKPLQLISVGRLHWKKGYSLLLDALHILYKNGIDFRLRIIGDGELLEALTFHVYQLGLNDKVHLMGRMPHSDISKQLDGADIYLQPSLQEGFCNSVLEAQAMGLICIVSNAEGLSENVLDGETGFVVPKGSAERIAEKIQEVAGLPQPALARISANARKRVSEQFTLDGQAKLFKVFYS